jgi:GNAT superfamily N-acetyltransferase
MSLPILTSRAAASSDDLLRLFHKTERHWAGHLGEEAQLGCGTAFTSPQLSHVWDANRLLDAALPHDLTPEQAVAEVEEHFAQREVRCSSWTMNPAAPPERTTPLVAHLCACGHNLITSDVMHLAGSPRQGIPQVGGLTIIPARASFRHYRDIQAEAAGQWNEPQLVEAAMLHLDDPHYDALIALRDGNAVAAAGVLGVGEVAAIQDVFVSETHRRQGLGLTMMSRILEICARSLYRHVLLYADDEPAKAMYRRLGFEVIGTYTRYRSPPVP